MKERSAPRRTRWWRRWNGQVDLFPVGTDPSYRVFSNSSWVPVFSVLTAGTTLPSGTNQWAIAAQLQRLDLAAD